jgi:hypothetical protein
LSRLDSSLVRKVSEVFRMDVAVSLTEFSVVFKMHIDTHSQI